MNGAESFVHMAAPADLANRIRSKELGAFDFDVLQIQLTCQYAGTSLCQRAGEANLLSTYVEIMGSQNCSQQTSQVEI